MAKTLDEWIADDVRPYEDEPVSWLSAHHFFRDPPRPTFADTTYFFAPADGIVLYQEELDPDEPLVEIKGRAYSVKDAIRDRAYSHRSLVIGIFMTFFDVHVNRIPYPGRLSYRELESIDSYNHPMLAVEKGILNDLRIQVPDVQYLRKNQRMLNKVQCRDLGLTYYIVQIADYDVDSILPFTLKQNEPVYQGERFSQIRYGSQVELIVPLNDKHRFVPLLRAGVHVEAGVDPLIRIEPREQPDG